MLIGLVADLISVNRRLSEEVLIRLKRMRSSERVQTSFRGRQPQRPAEEKKQETQWVWLLDEDKLDEATAAAAEPPQEPQQQQGRRRRRSRGGMQQHPELPGNRRKPLNEERGQVCSCRPIG